MSQSEIQGDLIILWDRMIQDVHLVLTPNNFAKPDNGKACWILIVCEGEVEWEFAEWQDGSCTLTEGWYLVGDRRPINEQDYCVLAWTYPPSISGLSIEALT